GIARTSARADRRLGRFCAAQSQPPQSELQIYEDARGVLYAGRRASDFTRQRPLANMSNVPPNRTGVALNERAIESLEFIRTTMARSAPFTAVSGAGGIAMGVLALVAAAFARSSSSNEQWLTVWVACAAVAVPLGFVLMRAKARRHDLALWSAAGRRFA